MTILQSCFHLARLNFLSYRVFRVKLYDGPDVVVGISSLCKMIDVSNYTSSRNFSGGVWQLKLCYPCKYPN